MKKKIITGLLVCMLTLCIFVFTACGQVEQKKIIRIGHNQSTNHPTHIALTAFKDYINAQLGEHYTVEVYPNELLGSQTDMVQLTQTGAIDFCVASNAILETFSNNYEIFNLPYLFVSKQAYHHAMDDVAVTEPIFTATKKAGFLAVTWLDAGTRNFYTVNKPIHEPKDLKGLKIRVQQSPTNIEMMKLLGGSATPMGFGDVYTALQANIIDGAENNELALTDNGHGDVCKYYSYDMHQMVPDILIGNLAFLEEMDAQEKAIFQEGYRLINRIQREEWSQAVEQAREKAMDEQRVQFIYPDQEPFKRACLPLQEAVLARNPELQFIYDKIQKYNTLYPAEEE